MRRALGWGLAIVSLAGVPVPRTVSAQSTNHASVPVVQAARAVGPIVVDGRLDEAAWAEATPATAFTQREPNEGQPATEGTELRIAYDDAALYAGVRLFDRESTRIVRQLSRRDRRVEADSFTLLLDPHHDHLTGAQFQVSAAGVQRDAIIYNDSWTDDSWDAVWESAVKIDDQGWTLEIRIPFSQLRFPQAERQTFGINAVRHIQRKNESAWLVFTPKTESGLASRMGHLAGIDGVRPRRTVELLPYTVGRAEFVAPESATDPFNDGARLFGGTGIDLKYRITGSLTLDGTINPDFGQVEVDPAVVNLTAFETFFEEKRPFFIEGSQIFGNFGRGGANGFWGFNRSEPLIFYSRRIGRPPQGPADGDFVDRPSATTILGAAKLTGKTRNGWSIGLLDASTAREHARVMNGRLGSSSTIEPLTNYFVGRLQRDFGRGAVGVLTTAVDRQSDVPALRDLLVNHAYVAGIDGHYFFDKKKEWVVTGRIAGSHDSGAAPAIARLERASQRYFNRPDAPHLQLDESATTLGGWTGSLNLNRNSGVHGVNAAWWAVSPGFDSSDAGFTFNADRAGAHVVYVWNNPKVTRFARRRFVAVSKFWTWNFAPELQRDGYFAVGNTQFKNYWTVFANAVLTRRGQDDRATRGGPSMLSPLDTSVFLGIETDSRRRVSLNGFVGASHDEFGGLSVRPELSINYRPATSIELSTGPRVVRDHTVAQYVQATPDPAAAATYGTRYVFARLKQTEISFQTRASLVLSPKMSVQVFAQPLVSVGAYSDFKELARPRTFDFVHYRGAMLDYDRGTRQYTAIPADGGARFPITNPDFNFKSLRLNAIFRWEWRPGSALYVVWTEQRQDDARPGRFAFRRDFGALFGAPPDDVLLVKFAYWFNR